MGGNLKKIQTLSDADWIKALNRLELKQDLPITLQGGEPTLHKDFYYIINNLREDIKIDILTNLKFDVKKFIRKIKPQRLLRNASDAPIRISYHPLLMQQDKLINNVLLLQNVGFKIGVFGKNFPDFENYNTELRKKCEDKNIDFRMKEFLGFYKNKLYVTYKYPDAVSGKKKYNS